MAGIKVARVQTNAHKNVVVRVEHEDGVLCGSVISAAVRPYGCRPCGCED
jgi:hypothetical protein